jgi:hypothetical protein
VDDAARNWWIRAEKRLRRPSNHANATAPGCHAPLEGEMSRIAFALVFCCAATLSVGAQEPQVGNTIVLVERDIHIPAHPAPGNGDVPFRFASGSTAVVLTIDAATGWLEIRGEEVGGADATGWITRGFIARIGTSPTNPQPQPPLQLPWCPDKGSPNPRPGGRLRIATWNIGNLHAVDGQPTFAGTDPSVKRFAIDYERIRCYIRMFDPDIPRFRRSTAKRRCRASSTAMSTTCTSRRG